MIDYNEEILYHYGIKRRSGRYPWGSGKRPHQGEASRSSNNKQKRKTERKERKEGIRKVYAEYKKLSDEVWETYKDARLAKKAHNLDEYERIIELRKKLNTEMQQKYAAYYYYDELFGNHYLQNTITQNILNTQTNMILQDQTAQQANFMHLQNAMHMSMPHGF